MADSHLLLEPGDYDLLLEDGGSIILDELAIIDVGSAIYPVTPTVTLRRQKLDHQRRAFSGKMRSALHHDTNKVARSWDFAFGYLTDAEALALQDVLTASGLVALGGAFADGATVACKVLDVTREDGQISDAVMINATFEEALS